MPSYKPMKCPKCNGSILRDGEEFVCINCGNVLQDSFTQKFVFNPQTKRYEERHQQELITKALMRYEE